VKLANDLETKIAEIEQLKKSEMIAKSRMSTKTGLKTCLSERDEIDQLKLEIENVNQEKEFAILTGLQVRARF